VYFGINGHMIFIEAMVQSFRLIPLDAWPATADHFTAAVELVMHYTGALFGIALAMVFPGLFACFMTDVVFGMLNRVAPQIHAYQLAMGIKALAGIALFLVALTMMIPQMVLLGSDNLEQLKHVLSFLANRAGL
jgi:flagellar biosynthetic protein FliR